MILSIVAFTVPLVLLFVADVQTFLVTSAYLYGLVLCVRFVKRQRALVDTVLLVVYLSIAFAQIGLGVDRIIPYTGTFVYAALGLLSLVGVATTPWTLPRNKPLSRERVLEHRVGNGLMLIGDVIALYYSLALFPKLAYIVLPLAVTAAAVLSSIFLSSPLIKLGASLRALVFMSQESRSAFREEFGNVRGLCLASERLLAKEVVTDRERELFFGVLEKAYYPLFQRSHTDPEGGYPALIERMRNEHTHYDVRASTFIVYDRRSRLPVGCLRIVSSNSAGAPLPLESWLPVTLAPLRKKARRLSEVGRLAIVGQAPDRARILGALVELMVVKLLLTGTRLLFTDALQGSMRLYQKMGLRQIGGPYEDAEFHQSSYLCVADIAELVAGSSIAPWERMKQSRLATFTIHHYLRTVRRGIRVRRFFGLQSLAVGESAGVQVSEVTT